MNRVDLSPRNLTTPIGPTTFFNNMEEVVITDEDINILHTVSTLHRYALQTVKTLNISLKILKIRIIRNSHRGMSLKLAKDIVEYLDGTLLK